MKFLIEMLKNKRSRPMFYMLLLVLFIVIFLILPKDGAPDLEKPNTVPYKTIDPNEKSSNFFTAEDEIQGPTIYATAESGDGKPSSYNLLANVGMYEDPTPPERKSALTNREKLFPHLPIFIQGFETSVGIKTNINVYVMPGDRKDTVRLEVYNIDYQNRESREEFNPFVTAYIESFQEAKSQIESKGVKVEDLNFITGSRENEIYTTQKWIKIYNLL